MKTKLLFIFLIITAISCQKEDYYNMDDDYLLTIDKSGNSYSENGISLDLNKFKWYLGVSGAFVLELDGNSNGDSIKLDVYANGLTYNKLFDNLPSFAMFDTLNTTWQYPVSDDKEYNIVNLTIYKGENTLEVADTTWFR